MDGHSLDFHDMAYQELPTHFAPNAFEGLRQVGSGIVYDLEKVQRLGSFMKTELNMDLPGDAAEIQYVWRAADSRQMSNDEAYYKQPYNAPYIPASELSRPLDNTSFTQVTKGTVAATGLPVFEVIVRDPLEPLTNSFARTLSFPPAHEAGFAVGLSAWRKFGQELDPRRSGKRDAVLKEAAKQFVGAIMLQPRVVENAPSQDPK